MLTKIKTVRSRSIDIAEQIWPKMTDRVQGHSARPAEAGCGCHWLVLSSNSGPGTSLASSQPTPIQPSPNPIGSRRAAGPVQLEITDSDSWPVRSLALSRCLPVPRSGFPGVSRSRFKLLISVQVPSQIPGPRSCASPGRVTPGPRSLAPQPHCQCQRDSDWQCPAERPRPGPGAGG
jgi:hypothetical protein